MASLSAANSLVSPSVAAPTDSMKLSAPRAARSVFLHTDESNAGSLRCLHGGFPVCLKITNLKTRSSRQRHSEPLSSSQRRGQFNQKTSSTLIKNGSFIQGVIPANEKSALVEVEDETDGSVMFKFGGLEDIWELDRMLEFLCRGAFKAYDVQSLVPIVVELLKVPISASAQRRLVELLSSYVQTDRIVDLSEAEKVASQILAEATSEFLPPTTAGYYKGRRRPTKRFSSRVDKWWQKVDRYLGIGEEDVEFWGDDEFRSVEGRSFLPEPLSFNESLVNCNDQGYKSLKAVESGPATNVDTRFTWINAPSSYDRVSGSSETLLLEAPKTLEFMTDLDSSFSFSGGNYTEGVGFLLLSSQYTVVDGALKASERAPSRWQTDVRPRAPPSFAETLPVSSIQDMIQWEQEEDTASVPSKKGQSKKTVKGSQRTKARSTHQRFQKAGGSRSPTKKRSSTDKVHDTKLFDVFFTLPLNHANSGVANFLNMRKGLSNEILAVLNQGSVVLAGGGLAVVLHVAAKMLSLSSTFDRYQMFGLIRGAALIWLSASMQKLRAVLMFLPPGCTIANYRDKKQLVNLQHQLRHLSFRAVAVFVLSVVGTGL
ncbi:hypothetical protein R1flu_025504 [Riccia fluitans]|uniref:Uncharacterized protein n=1 Tax=Riccia fluitans TaxID=41844 RepID=A0ABD1XY53_9MARC